MKPKAAKQALQREQAYGDGSGARRRKHIDGGGLQRAVNGHLILFVSARILDDTCAPEQVAATVPSLSRVGHSGLRVWSASAGIRRLWHLGFGHLTCARRDSPPTLLDDLEQGWPAEL